MAWDRALATQDADASVAALRAIESSGLLSSHYEPGAIELFLETGSWLSILPG
jgi:hypothetical protein